MPSLNSDQKTYQFYYNTKIKNKNYNIGYNLVTIKEHDYDEIIYVSRLEECSLEGFIGEFLAAHGWDALTSVDQFRFILEDSIEEFLQNNN